MSVKIRLKRMGSKKRPFYRIIATDSRMPRDGRFIETLGYYDPMKQPAEVNIKEDLVFKWMKRGAQPSSNTEQILRNAGVLKKWSLLKKGVSPEELESKYEQLKASETPPMDPSERERKRSDKKAAAEAEATAAAEAAAAPQEPSVAEEAAEPAGDAPATPPGDAEAAGEGADTSSGQEEEQKDANGGEADKKS